MEQRSGDGDAVPGAALPAIGRAFGDGRLAAERLVQHCLDRIEAYDQRGPRGLPHGIPVVVPAGHTAAGLPLAAQLIARPYADTTLLQLATCSTRPPAS